MDRVHVIAIPRKELSSKPFYKTSTIESHEDLLKDFYKRVGLEEPEYGNYHVDLVKKGVITVLAFGKVIVAFIPSVITEEQFDILKSYQQFFKTFDEINIGIFNEDMIELNYKKEKNPNMVDDFYKVIQENTVGSKIRK